MDHHQRDVDENEGENAEHDGEVDAAGDRIAAEQPSQPNCTGFQMESPVITCRMTAMMTPA